VRNDHATYISVGKYTEAADIFQSLTDIDYEDSSEMLNETYYQQGVAKYKDGEYEDAYKIFLGLADIRYEDAVKQLYHWSNKS